MSSALRFKGSQEKPRCLRPALPAKGCLSRPRAAFPNPCPGSSFVRTLRGCLLPVPGRGAVLGSPPEPFVCPPQPNCRPLFQGGPFA